MFCYIKYAEWEDSKCDEENPQKLEPNFSARSLTKSALQENRTLLVNPNCYIRILIDYIAEKVNFDFQSAYFDLCSENGDLLRVNEIRPCESATKVMAFQKTYIVVKCSRSSDGAIKGLEPLLYTNSREYFDIKSRLKKYISASTKKSAEKLSIRRQSDESMKLSIRRQSVEDSLHRASSSRSSRRTLQSPASSKYAFSGKTSYSAK